MSYCQRLFDPQNRDPKQTVFSNLLNTGLKSF